MEDKDGTVREAHRMTSAWFPTTEEIEALRNGAAFYLMLLTTAHPPVALKVGNAAPMDEEG